MTKLTNVLLATLFGFQGISSAVPLENWRLPFYRMAEQRGEQFGSPSGMFWDNLGSTDLFDSSLWLDSADSNPNSWQIEPSLSLEAQNQEYITGERTNYHFDLLSDIRLGRLLVRTALDVDGLYKDDPYYHWHQDRAAAGRVEEAYLQYSGDHWFARFGRTARNWGPFVDRSIFLSNNPFTYDAFEWQLFSDFFEFRHLFAAFPLQYSWYDTRGEKIPRYLSAHALNLILGSWGSVGVSESVVYSRPEGLPDLQYLNPVSIYTVINTNREAGTGNLMLGFQGWLHPGTKDVTLKGQVVFDDFQVDNEDIHDQEPLHWAYDCGVSWKDALPLPKNFGSTLFAEYRYLSKWMYTVPERNTENGERYLYQGQSLGNSWIDGDLLRAGVTVIGDNYWAGTVGAGYGRRDTNTVATVWQNVTTGERKGHLGYRTEAPLSKRANVRTTFSLFLEADAYFRDLLSLHASIENRFIENSDFDRSKGFEYDPLLSLRVSGHYGGWGLSWGGER